MRFVMTEILTDAQAKAAGYISLEEAARLTGADRSTLFRRATAGKVPSCQIKKGSRLVYWVLASALGAKVSQASPKAYERLVDQWKKEMLGGSYGKKPYSQKTVDGHLYGLAKYWENLGEKPSVAGISAENYRRVRGTFAVDEAERRDYFATKRIIHEALKSFMRFLVRDGLRAQADFDALAQERPIRKFKPKKLSLEDWEIVAIRDFNRQWVRGRALFDVAVTDLLICLYAYGGLRRQEALNLRLEDIDWKRGVLQVFGKGSKERPVKIHPEVRASIKHYLGQYRPETPSSFLILKADGDQFKPKAVNDRFERLREALEVAAKKRQKTEGAEPGAGIQGIHPHALRRAFATIMTNEGMPITHAQLLLGHSNIETTRGYIQTSFQHASDWWDRKFDSNQAAAPKEKQESDDSIREAALNSLFR